MASARTQALVCQASPAPGQAELASDLYDREAIAVLAAAAQAVAGRDSVTEETRTRLQDDVVDILLSINGEDSYGAG